MTMSLVECVPNFSEGRDPSVIAALRDAIAGTPGAWVLDVSSDASHHRTVITFVASLEAAVPAALAAMTVAQARIDLTTHRGAHPRIGATDVVPFIPLQGATMEQCVALARELGARAAAELHIPVYLYERAATTTARQNLANVRRGEFEGLRDAIRTDPTRSPDFGPHQVHPTAGATAIGARPFLVAYNVYLGDAVNLPAAKAVAKAIRESSGGLPYVKALGLEVDGQAQVSMNLVDTGTTALHVAFDLIKTEAAAHGIAPTWSEIVGLVPERVLLEAGAHHIQLHGFSQSMVLETKVRDVLTGRSNVDSLESARAALQLATDAATRAVPGSTADLIEACGAALRAEASCKAAVLAARMRASTLEKTGSSTDTQQLTDAQALVDNATAQVRALEASVERALTSAAG